MSPSDSLAAEVVDYFAMQRSSAYVHEWSEPNQVLFIDNRWSLHARNAVEAGDESRTITRLAFVERRDTK